MVSELILKAHNSLSLGRKRGAALVYLVAALASAAAATTGVMVAKTSGVFKERERTTAVSSNFKRVTNALLAEAWRADTGVIPCPADPTQSGANFGVATAAAGTVCNTSRGIVPFRTIGISERAARDGYGTFFTYVVDPANASACSGTSGRSGDLADNGGPDGYLFALISHGPNQAGGYLEEDGMQSATAMSTQEDDNCPTDGSNCNVSASDEVRSGPYDEDTFDDTVRLFSASALGSDCQVVNDAEDSLQGGTDAQAGFNAADGSQQQSKNFTETATSDANNTRGVSEPTGVNDEVQVRFTSDGQVATASCEWHEGAFRIRDSVIRVYMEYAARNDSGDVRGNGAVLAFMSADPDTYTLSNTTCGGTDEKMGFADDDVIGARALPAVPRLGIEIDTESHYNAAALPPNVNKDADGANGHIAILATNNDHAGNVTSSDGPACRTDTLPGLGINGSTLEGCLTNLAIEVGDNTPTDGDFHALRTELHYDHAECGGAGSDQILVKVWNSLSDGSDNATYSSGFDVVYADFGQSADIEYCVPWTTDSADDYVRFGLTSGNAAGGGGIRDQFTVQNLAVRSQPSGDVAVQAAAATTASSIEVSNVALVSVLGDGTSTNNNNNTNSALAVMPASGGNAGVTLLANKGTFTVNYQNTAGVADNLYDDQGIGINGIGNFANGIDNYWDGSSGSGVYPHYDTDINSLTLSNRERITILFNEAYERVTLNLGRFDGNYTLPAPDSIDVPERVVVRAFQGSTLYSTQIVEACSLNTNGNQHHMAVSLDYTGNAIDAIQIIPHNLATSLDSSTGLNDSDNPISESYSTSFYLRGAKGCGADNSCGLLTDNQCYTYQGDHPWGGLGTPTVDASDTISQDELENTFNGGTPLLLGFDGTGESPWIHLENGTTGALNVDIFGTGDTDNEVHINSDGTVAREGFGVTNQNLDYASNESLEFRFMHNWTKVGVAIGRFDRTNNAPRLEQMLVQGYNGVTAVGSQLTLQGCNVNNNDAVAEFEIEFPSEVNRIVFTPTIDSGGVSNTSAVIHALRTCTNDYADDCRPALVNNSDCNALDITP